MGLSEVVTYISYTSLIATFVLEGLGILRSTIFYDSQMGCIQDYIEKNCSSFSFTKSYFVCFGTTFLQIQINTIVFFKVVNLVVVITVISYLTMISTFFLTFFASLASITKPLVQKILGFMMMTNVFLISIIILVYATVYANEIRMKLINKVEDDVPENKPHSFAALYSATALSFVCSLSYFYNPIKYSSSRRDSEDSY